MFRPRSARQLLIYIVIDAAVLWILWFVAGGLALPTVAEFGEISSYDVIKQQFSRDTAPKLVTICQDAQPIAALSLLTAVICQCYLHLPYLNYLLTDTLTVQCCSTPSHCYSLPPRRQWASSPSGDRQSETARSKLRSQNQLRSERICSDLAAQRPFNGLTGLDGLRCLA